MGGGGTFWRKVGEFFQDIISKAGIQVTKKKHRRKAKKKGSKGSGNSPRHGARGEGGEKKI